MRTHITLALVIALSTLGCNKEAAPNKSVQLEMDMFGFVLNGSKTAPRLDVGVGDTGEKLIQKNPYLEKVIWLPKTGDGNVFDEMRLALQSQSEVHYNDGDIKLSVCAHSVSADGHDNFKYGVAFVGIKLCEAPINDYKRAIQLAKEIISQLERNNPEISNLRNFYRSASQQELTAIGGEIWEGIAVKAFTSIPAPRDNPDREYLFTLEEAESHFANKLANPQYKNDVNGQPRLEGGGALLAVYAGKYAIFELGIHSDAHWGGVNLTKEKLDEQRYDVTMHFRLRSDIDPHALSKAAMANPSFQRTASGSR